MNRLLKQFYRYKRLLNPSFAERQFKAAMGLTWYILGCKREYPVRGYFVDVAIHRWGRMLAIEIDGKQYHKDVIKDWEREQVVMAAGYSVLRVPAHTLKDPRYVRREVWRFFWRVPLAGGTRRSVK